MIEFSQNYVLFSDKFERANFFLTDIIATRSGARNEIKTRCA